jgi:hypothetical protein
MDRSELGSGLGSGLGRWTMKSLALAVVVAAAVAGPIAPGEAEASYFTGSLCQPYIHGLSWYSDFSMESVPPTNPLNLKCPMPVNGSVPAMTFDYKIWRDYGAGTTWCAGSAWDSSGNAVYQTNFAQVSGTSHQGTYMHVTPTAGPAGAASYVYATQCGLSVYDTLLSLRLGPA